MKSTNSLGAWLEERVRWSQLTELGKKKEVPQHGHTLWYYFGGISLYLFLIQLVTGILLLVYYSPTVDGAHSSILDIISKVEFGWLGRSVHVWAAHPMVLAGVIPLPGDELAYFATRVGVGVRESGPLLGGILASLLRGGPQVGELTLQRFFALHVVVLPLIFMGALGFHLFLIQLHGNAAPPSFYRQPAAQRRTIPFFPNFFYNDLLVWLICLNLLSFLAALYPWQVGPQADPLQPAPAGIHPEWYFMAPFALLKVLPNLGPLSSEHAGILLFSLGGLLWALVPFWDQETADGRRGRLATYAGPLG